MEALAAGEIFMFEGFRLDRRGLFRRDEGGVFAPVAIGSRGLDVLRVLITAGGGLVSKDEIMAAVWPGTVVEENNLTVQIAALRRMLDRGRAEGSCIQTVAGRGYRFVATVTRHATGADSRSAVVSDARRPPPLSIVVLPFANLSNDQDQEYFTDAVTDDLTTDLSRISGSFVIARSTAFTYKGKALDAKQAGRELGVRYVLEGSVRRSGNRVRVNTQLIDAETDAHLWAERFDRDTDDLFALQDEITSRIAIELNLELIGAETARPAKHPDVLDCLLRGRAAMTKPPSRDTYSEAIRLFEHALALDPRSADAQSWLATALVYRVLDQVTTSAAADKARAERLIDQALAVSPRLPQAHFARGMLLRTQGRPEEAIPEYETVIASNRNRVDTIAALGWAKFWTGSMEQAIELNEQAIRLSPRDPLIAIWYYRIGLVHLLQSRIDEAIVWLEKARSAVPVLPLPHAHLASAYALKGDTDRAAAELAEVRRLCGDNRYSSIASLKAIVYFGVPNVRALFETIYIAGLRMAGMPEE
jgi:TolB-like protein/Tfp pilus assembly protein PilF